MKYSTIQTIFLSSGFPEKRHLYVHEIEENDDQQIQSKSKIKVKGRDGKFIKSNVSKQERYDLRPQDDDDEVKYQNLTLYQRTNGILNSMSMAQFCMIYEPKSKSEKEKVKRISWYYYGRDLGGIAETTKEIARTDDEIKNLPQLLKDFLIGLPFPQWIQLKGAEERYMKLRSIPYILRIYNGKHKDPIEDIYSELLLFSPWRNENKINPWDEDDDRLKEDVLDYELEREKALQKVSMNEEIRENNEYTKEMIYPFSKKLHKIRDLLDNENFQRTSTFYDSININSEQQNEEDLEEQEPLDETDIDINVEIEEIARPSIKPKKISDTIMTEKLVFKKPILPTDKNELYDRVRLFSYEQRVVFDKYIHFLKCIICAKHGGNIEPIPPRIIVHGGGGCGKTFLIKILSQWIEYILRSPGDNVDYPKVIRLAPTGAAAYLIGGTTFYTGLRFSYGNEYSGIHSEQMSVLRRQFEDMMVVIIDEMSMVGADFFYNVHRRMVEILQVVLHN